MRSIVSKPNSVTTKSEIINAKYLILQLARRDFFVRYRQTGLGFLWAVINPLTSFIMFAFVFSLLVKIPTPEYSSPYSAVLIVGILFWNFFSASLTSVSDSLINNIGLIKKVYFPRVVFGLASVFVAVIDLLIALIFFIPVLWYLDVTIQFPRLVVYLPFCILTTLLFAWGMGAIIAILKVKYKDFRHVVPLVMQILFYASPIVYTLSIVPEKYMYLYKMNPFSHILTLARYVFLNGKTVPSIATTLGLAMIVAIVGSVYFVMNERKVVDLK
ncbi:MAG: ABC transporter permease [Sodalis sp. (in: enterobacteria)]|uniref:ABC transporter permease n=1 Tax=Sodalis sp. (in: enterobacteria) TaxID=1898979 RepID=UPI003F37EF04